MKIDKEILDLTTDCTNDFICLKGEDSCCAQSKVEHSVSSSILFINCENDSCTYQTSFGFAKVCNCPTRKEIYRKYRI